MEVSSPRTGSFLQSDAVRRWVSRAFIVSIVVYLVVLGYLVAESVTGASKWAPYGVNMPVFVALIISSEFVMLVTGVQIFREDAGIWPPSMSVAWDRFRNESKLLGSLDILSAAWDISIIDLRLRSSSAIFMGRLNRVASVVPLAYALIASAGGAPWGLRGSAFFDIAISVVVWAFMEVVMVRPEQESGQILAPAIDGTSQRGAKQSSYSVRPVRMDDLDRLLELEKRNWRDQGANRQCIEARLRNYPEGQLVAVHTTLVDGVPVKSRVSAWCTLMPVTEDLVGSFTSWDELTGDGSLSTTDRNGKVLIGVNLTSVTEGGTYILSAEALVSVVERGMKKLMVGSRLTGFVSFNHQRTAEGKAPLSADEYAHLREIRGFRLNEERFDAGLAPLSDEEYRQQAAALRDEAGEAPLTEDDVVDYVCSNLRGYMSIPGVQLVRVAEGYFRDPASADYGVILQWPNPIPSPVRHIPFVKEFVVRRIREEVAGEWEDRKRRLHEKAVRRRAEQVPPYLRKAGATEAASSMDASRAKAPAQTRETVEG